MIRSPTGSMSSANVFVIAVRGETLIDRRMPSGSHREARKSRPHAGELELDEQAEVLGTIEPDARRLRRATREARERLDGDTIAALQLEHGLKRHRQPGAGEAANGESLRGARPPVAADPERGGDEAARHSSPRPAGDPARAPQRSPRSLVGRVASEMQQSVVERRVRRSLTPEVVSLITWMLGQNSFSSPTSVNASNPTSSGPTTTTSGQRSPPARSSNT